MICWIVAVLAVVFGGVRGLRDEDGYARERTVAVNGFFALFILLSHGRMFMNALGYSWFDEFGSRWAMYFLMAIGQLCVVPFLFFSGYGIVKQIKKKGKDYVDGLPRRRVWPFYVNSLPVAIMWVACGCFMPTTVYPQDALCQLVFWRGIDFGPCWYNFCIIVLYMSAFVAFKIAKGAGAECIVWLLSMAYVLGMSWIRPDEPWWFSTALAFPMGVSFSLHRERWSALMDKFFWLMLGLSVALVVGYKLLPRHDLLHNVYGMCFMVMLLTLMQKARLDNPVLNWVGARVFPIYMYHLLFYRLWSFCFDGKISVWWQAHLVLAASFACTGLVAWAYPRFSYKVQTK